MTLCFCQLLTDQLEDSLSPKCLTRFRHKIVLSPEGFYSLSNPMLWFSHLLFGNICQLLCLCEIRCWEEISPQLLESDSSRSFTVFPHRWPSCSWQALHLCAPQNKNCCFHTVARPCHQPLLSCEVCLHAHSTELKSCICQEWFTYSP